MNREDVRDHVWVGVADVSEQGDFSAIGVIDVRDEGLWLEDEEPEAVAEALAIVDAVRPLGIEIRAGLHAGEVELVENKLAGIAVHTGARVAAKAGPSEVLVSQTVKDLVAGSGLVFESVGEHHLKGVPDRWRLYRAVG